LLSLSLFHPLIPLLSCLKEKLSIVIPDQMVKSVLIVMEKVADKDDEMMLDAQ